MRCFSVRGLIQTSVRARKDRMRARAEYKSRVFTMLGRVHSFSKVSASGRETVKH